MSEGTPTPGAEPPTTGRPAVDEAIGRLADLDERPVSEHPETLAEVHETLHTELQPRSGPNAG